VAVPHKHKIILPATLQHVTPGELPINLLAEVKPYGKLHLLAAQAWMAWRDRAFADGIKTFKPTSAADTYRSLATQTIAWCCSGVLITTGFSKAFVFDINFANGASTTTPHHYGD